MSRPPFQHAGVSHDLSHLAPTTLLCPRLDGAMASFRIAITFSHHCYTGSAVMDPVTAVDLTVTERGDVRYFDPDRWRLSREHLPGMIASLPAARVQFTPELRNYRYALAAQLSVQTEYALFFSLRRSGDAASDLRMVIESAYPIAAGSRGKAPGVIRFAMLAQMTFRGQKVRVPPRR